MSRVNISVHTMDGSGGNGNMVHVLSECTQMNENYYHYVCEVHMSRESTRNLNCKTRSKEPHKTLNRVGL